jgi:outer membrane protein assembly factor BamB
VLTAVCAALALFDPSPASADPVLRAPAAHTPRVADPAWSFDVGAPLSAPPGITRDGSVLVVNHEGYLHSLRPDGGFRFSYSLRGRVVGTPRETADGLIVVAAEPNRLVTLDSQGGLVWVSTVAGGIATGPAVDDKGRIWVGTHANTLLAFSPRGGVVGFAKTGAVPLVGPVVLSSGAVALAWSSSIRIAGGPSATLEEAGWGRIRQLFRGNGSLLALGEAGLLRFDEERFEERWRRASVTRIVCGEPGLVVIEGEGLRWLTARGEPGLFVPLAGATQGPMTCLPGGSVLVAGDARSLLRVGANGAVSERRIPVGPVLSLASTGASLIVIGYRNGRIVAVRSWT